MNEDTYEEGFPPFPRPPHLLLLSSALKTVLIFQGNSYKRLNDELLASVNQSLGKSKFTFPEKKKRKQKFIFGKMILAALILFFSFAASEPQNGFYPIVRTENRTRQSQQEHLVLTTDGRLQRLQLVFPQGTRVSEPQTGQYVLTPDGRIEQPQVEREYLKLTNEGKLQRVQKEELPQEETGESADFFLC